MRSSNLQPKYRTWISPGNAVVHKNHRRTTRHRVHRIFVRGRLTIKCGVPLNHGPPIPPKRPRTSQKRHLSHLRPVENHTRESRTGKKKTPGGPSPHHMCACAIVCPVPVRLAPTSARCSLAPVPCAPPRLLPPLIKVSFRSPANGGGGFDIAVLGDVYKGSSWWDFPDGDACMVVSCGRRSVLVYYKDGPGAPGPLPSLRPFCNL